MNNLNIKKMKKIILTLLFFFFFKISNHAQSILKDDKSNPEKIWTDNINKQLQKFFPGGKVQEHITKIFFVKFKLSKKSEIEDVIFSANLTDTTIINIVTNSITKTNSLWDLKKVEKLNPNLTFLLPVHLHILKYMSPPKFSEKEEHQFKQDFSSMLKYSPIESTQLECLFCVSDTKFVGMVLNPILVQNFIRFDN